MRSGDMDFGTLSNQLYLSEQKMLPLVSASSLIPSIQHDNF
jgi:hypothetical protein